MALVNHVVERFGSASARITWPNMKQGDVGEPVTFSLHQDRSVQVIGTFGTGGSVAINGSNNNVDFVALTDMRGNNLTISQPRIEQIEDCTYAVRPEVVSGDPTTNLSVIIFARSGV
jgi:hypothetical protein